MNPVRAIARRDLIRYFTSPTGYIFITVFIFLSACAQFWEDNFFTSNLANLAILNERFPFILLFFIPAVAMGTWADERRHGTEELLMTLPLTDAQLVLGKYFAALGVYAISLLFSISHIFVLAYLGSPDLGLMIGTYAGYLLLGAALLPIAMLGSLIAESATVGFILGALFCAVPVIWGRTEGLLGEHIASAGVDRCFADFTSGVVSLKGLVYFGAMAAVALFYNYEVRLRRRTGRIGGHLLARAFFLLVAVASLCVMSGRSSARVDLTSEKLHSLAKQTRDVIKSIPEDKPITIQAYVSLEVPDAYLDTRENLLGLLNDISSTGGSRVILKVNETTKATDAAREADDKYGIKPVKLMREHRGGGGTPIDVFLGMAVTRGAEEIVIPFFFRGISVEYQVTQALRTVVKTQRSKVGILTTELKWFGGNFDMQTMSMSPPWQIVDELKKQYEVVQVDPDAIEKESVQCLVVPMASTLTQPQMDKLRDYVAQGKPTLFLDDPLPMFNPTVGPNETKRPRGMGRPPEPDNRGNFRDFYKALGFDWEPHEVAWDKYNPLPPPNDQLPPEFVFVGRGAGNREPFNVSSSITSGLQLVVLMAPGRVRSAQIPGLSYTELLRTGKAGGMIPYSTIYRTNPMSGRGGMVPAPHRPMGDVMVLAARVEGKSTPAKAGDKEVRVNAMLIADVDMVESQMFELRRQGMENLNFDNVTFVLNCVDDLAGDSDFIELRKRRPKHRTLETVEALKRRHQDKAEEENQAAEDKAKKELEEAQTRFNEKIKELAERTDLDEFAKASQAAQIHEVETRRLEVEQRRINDDKERAVSRSESARDRELRKIQDEIRLLALFLPPIPAILIFMIALYHRIKRELEARR